MADYVQILDTQIEPDAPLTSTLAAQWRDNPIAIAEGAAGAPRNRPLSLDLLIGGQSFELTGTTPVNFIDLSGISSLIVVASVTGLPEPNETIIVSVEVSYSTNNGVDWSAWQGGIVSIAGVVESGNMVHINLIEGRINSGTPITGAAGSNAVRFRKTSLNGNARVMVYGMGRT
jgi:hypothetical protein